MIQAAVLMYETPKGEIGSVADPSLDPIRALAEKARITGLVDKVQVKRGAVMCTWRPGVQYKFLVEPDVVIPPKVMTKSRG